MDYLSEDALLGASDLTERDVDLRPHIDGTVRVRALAGTYSNQAVAEASYVNVTTSGAQTSRLDVVKLEELQVLHGLVRPKLDSLEKVHQFGSRCGPSWKKITREIQEISGIGEEDVEKTNRLFQAGGSETPGIRSSNGTGSGDAGPDRVVPTGGEAPHAGGGDVPQDERA